MSPLSRLSFNSSVVRLKVPAGIEPVEPFNGFNSSVVRLKGLLTDPVSFILYSFNSSVVRLKVFNFPKWIEVFMFQFQCGAIKSRLLIVSQSTPSLFQFQCGAIKRSKLCCVPVFTVVSIPVWCD